MCSLKVIKAFYIYTLENQHLEPKVIEVWKMIFFFNWVTFTFQPLLFRGIWTYNRLNHALLNKGIQATQTLQQLIFHSSYLNPTTSAVTSFESLKLYTPEKNERMSPEKKEICQQGKYIDLPTTVFIFRGHASFFGR